ncbi:Gstm5, partial [Symbiodinium pilosum]
ILYSAAPDSLAMNRWVCPLTVDLPLVVFFLFFFFGHTLTREVWTPSVWFDKACINQAESEKKKEAIGSLPDFLKRSARLLVLWDETYFDRLWCSLEIATFAKHRSDPHAIRVLDRFVAPWLLGCLLSEWLIVRLVWPWFIALIAATSPSSFGKPDTVSDYVILGILGSISSIICQSPCAAVSAVCFTLKLQQRKVMLDSFANFDIRCAQCALASDRPVLQAQIARLFDEIDDKPISVAVDGPEALLIPAAAEEPEELLELVRNSSIREITSYPSHDDCLDIFNRYVRAELYNQIISDLGSATYLHWWLAFLAFLPQQFFTVGFEFLQCEQMGCQALPEV